MTEAFWNKLGALALIGVFCYLVLVPAPAANCPTLPPQPDAIKGSGEPQLTPAPLPAAQSQRSTRVAAAGKTNKDDAGAAPSSNSKKRPDSSISSAESSRKSTTPTSSGTANTAEGLEDTAPLWLRGNFARFSAKRSDKNCKAYPSIGTLGVSCRPKAWKKATGGGDSDGGDASFPSVVFELQHPGLSVTKVVGSPAGQGENMYKSNIMGNTKWDKTTGPREVTPARSMKYSYQVERVGSTAGGDDDDNSDGGSKRSRYDTVTIRLPSPAGEDSKPDAAAGGGNFVFLFDLEVKDPAATLKNASTCFISIGDWGNPQPCQKEVSQVMAKVAEENWARFIVSTGDNFYPTGVKGKNDPQFETKFEKVYNKAFEGMALPNLQWVLCAGNHDQWGLQGELDYGRAHPQWWMPGRVFAKRVPVGVQSTANLIILDTYNRMRGSWERQAKWFEQQMLESEAVYGDEQEDPKRGGVEEWKLVINHEPVYCGSNHGLGPDNAKIKKFWKPLFDKHQAEAYFNGDDHTLQISRANQTDYFVSGGGGGSTGYEAKQLPENVWYSKKPVFGVMLHCISDGWSTANSGGGIMTTKLFNKEGQHVHTHYTKKNSKKISLR